MTWKLTHNTEIVGEWSEDIIGKMAQKLKNKPPKSHATIIQNEAFAVIAEFLPDPIRDALAVDL